MTASHGVNVSDNPHSGRHSEYDDLRQRLKMLGCEISDTRVPYTYHHDMARNYAIMNFQCSPSRSDIAGALDNACAGVDDVYRADIFLGCIAYFLQFAKPDVKIKMLMDDGLMAEVAMHQKALLDNGKTLFWYVCPEIVRVGE